MGRKVREGYRFTYTLGDGKREEICLGGCYDNETKAGFKVLVKNLAASIRCGIRLSIGDARRIEALPLALRKILVSRKLIEGTADEVIPMLSVLLDAYVKSRVQKKADNRDKRSCSYLMEYFGDIRIDQITPVKAAGIRNYLLTERPKPKGKRGGCLTNFSINRAITDFRAVFNFAVDCKWLKASPFAKVKGGKDSDPNRMYYVSYTELQAAIDCCDNNELKGILAFARYAGLRIPSEIRDLKFSDFEDVGIFNVPKSGKTGERRVPLFDELKPYLELLRESAGTDSVYLFPYYRQRKNISEVIKKKMRKSGLPIWEKFFINCRSSCITDKNNLGWIRSDMDAVFGNSEDIRLQNYVQEKGNPEYAKLGRAVPPQGCTPIETPTFSTGLIPEQDLCRVVISISDAMLKLQERHLFEVRREAVRSSVYAVKQALSRYFDGNELCRDEIRKLTAQAVNELDEVLLLEDEELGGSGQYHRRLVICRSR